jgi:UDP-N-acetyl-D-mannosaminuronic acid dehydrogenase
MKLKKICVIGLGYIGLPTATLLASRGYQVAGIDINEQVIEKMNQGKIHFIEPDLHASFRSAINSGRLTFFTKPQPSDIYIICVPTPLQENISIPKPNMEYVFNATRSIAPLVQAGNFIILESTSPVGTTLQIRDLLRDLEAQVDKIHIAYCPERVLPGKIMIEIIENDRIVGGLNLDATKAVANFYRDFVRGQVFETDSKTAELCKLTENSFRDVNIAFANELSLICDKQGIDVWDLIRLANRHPRVKILQPGIGVGGHCIAVDPWFIVSRDKENSRLIRKAREINNYKKDWVIEKIKLIVNDIYNRTKKKPKIACLGLSFKPDIDDLRESPALNVTETLIKEGYDVIAVEPNIKQHPSIHLVSLKDACQQADIILILVKHREFIKLKNLDKLQPSTILDFCGALI